MAKRSLFMTFLNTAPSSTASYALIGQGVTELSISYNPQTKTEQFINQDSADTSITGYQPNAPVTMQVKKGDPVFEFVNNIRKTRAIGEDAVTDIVTVDAFDTESAGAYTAEKQSVSVQIDSFGGPATDPLSIGFTLNYKGDPVPGTFNPSTKTFTESE
jgi:hypothetical protein